MVEFNKGYGTALRFIANRMKTEAEVRKKLRSLYSDELAEEVIERLKAHNYIDDDNYISCYIKDRMKFNPMGRFRIKKELEEKGVQKNLIENNHEYNCIEEIPVIEDLINRKLSRYNLNDSKDKRRIINYLIRRGFGFENINSVLGHHNEFS
jgi:regulatory protein